ncbi:MAG: hypothetical protein MRY64_15835 [Hyphomonadaceae bacterium]|nr:hypothetical protein [Hyphomonadaceae bacterium]
MMKFASCAAAALVLCAGVGSAQSELNGCTSAIADGDETNIYFSNGIRTDSDEANVTVQYLRGIYKQSLEGSFEGETYSFYSAPNPTIGTYSDIVEVLNQKLEEAGIADEGLSALQLLELLRAGLSAEEIRRAISLAVGISTRVPPVITELFLEEAEIEMSQAQAAAIANIGSVEGLHANYYVSDLQAGKRVFVIAHSQGNLFANASLSAAATSLPTAADSLGMIGVATPAAQQFASSFYRTADDDRVIQALSLIETVLPANIDNVPMDDFRSISNHLFERDYMDARLPSRDAIDAELVRLAGSVPFPALDAGEGAIRATLTWDEQPDVDLHAFEPNGAHVFYSSRIGPSGFLDVDDTTSFGPENYFVECDTIELGVYTIGVNYYSGLAPSTATVSLFLGDGRTPTPRTVTLPTALGSAGNNSPQILFTIGVALQDEIVRYTVE